MRLFKNVAMATIAIAALGLASCEKEKFEKEALETMDVVAPANGDKLPMEAPTPEAVTNNTAPAQFYQKAADIEAVQEALKSTTKKKSNFSLSYTKECTDYNFHASVEPGGDIYQWYVYRDGNLLGYVGQTNGWFENTIDFTLVSPGNGSYTVRAKVWIWDTINGVWFSIWSAYTPAVTINNNFNSWTGAGNNGKWYVGDFNGDGRDDIFRYMPGVSGAQVLLSNGSSFGTPTSWTGAGFGDQGWYIGDFNGDNRDDILRYVGGTSGAQVYLSNGSSFNYAGSWTGAGNNGKWYIGDFNGDGRDDIFRYVPGVSGAQVMLSTGSSFASPVSWTGAGYGDQGWYVGDFNGDNRDDIFRYVGGTSGAQVYLSTGSSFSYSGSWTGSGNNGKWYIGDYNGDNRDDIFRYAPGVSGAQVFLSNGSGFSSSGSWTTAGYGDQDWYVGKFTSDNRTDIFRYINCETGADMWRSTGSSFVNN